MLAEFCKDDTNYVLVLLPPGDICLSYRSAKGCDEDAKEVAVIRLSAVAIHVCEHEGERSPGALSALALLPKPRGKRALLQEFVFIVVSQTEIALVSAFCFSSDLSIHRAFLRMVRAVQCNGPCERPNRGSVKSFVKGLVSA